MNVESIRTGLSRWPQPRQDGSRLIVTTHCLYPSRDVVLAYIEGGGETAIVSDGGGAFDQIDAHGEYEFDPFKVLKRHLATWNLKVDRKGWIHSAPVPHEHVSSVVSIVATASAKAAEVLLSHFRPKRRDFRVELNKLLHRKFSESVHEGARLVGASNKSHLFDYVIDLDASRRLAVDAVTMDPSSINAAIVAHMDIKQAEIPGLAQRIVYDDRENWKSADLSLLAVGSTPVGFTRLEPAMDRLVKREAAH